MSQKNPEGSSKLWKSCGLPSSLRSRNVDENRPRILQSYERAMLLKDNLTKVKVQGRWDSVYDNITVYLHKYVVVTLPHIFDNTCAAVEHISPLPR